MKILTFGEVLWDLFPQRREIGGTALNFSAHMAALGDPVQLISAVGNDELGLETRKYLTGLGLNLQYVTTQEVLTGRCNVTVAADGTPSYSLQEDVSYDHIVFQQPIPEDAAAFYFGTLSQRGEVSRSTLARILTRLPAGCLRFCDINIRAPFYDADSVERCLKNCDILKVSRDEAYVFPELGFCEADSTQPEALCRELCRRYAIRQVILTMDSEGAMVYLPEEDRFIRALPPPTKVLSTVGAGDSFSACYVHNLLAGKTPEACLERAVLLSAYVVSCLGAVPAYPPQLLEEIR